MKKLVTGAWWSVVGTLLARGSRTAWGVVTAVAAALLPALLPPLLANLGSVQELAAALNAPAWVRPAITLAGVIAGGIAALIARVDSQTSGRDVR